MFTLFDKVICLAGGNIVYDGTPSNLGPYLSRFLQKSNEELPSYIQPIEYLMGILQKDQIRIMALRNGVKIGEEEVESKFL